MGCEASPFARSSIIMLYSKVSLEADLLIKGGIFF
jgi:hypothetical protein